MMAIFTEGPERPTTGSAACVLCIVFTNITRILAMLFSPTIVGLLCAGLHLELFHQTNASTTGAPTTDDLDLDSLDNATESSTNATFVATPYNGWGSLFGLQPWLTYTIIAGSFVLLIALIACLVCCYKKAKKQSQSKGGKVPSKAKSKSGESKSSSKKIILKPTEKDLAAYKAIEEAKLKPGEKYDHKAAMMTKFLNDSNKIVGTTAGKQLSGTDVINIINEQVGAYADQEEFESVSQRNFNSTEQPAMAQVEEGKTTPAAKPKKSPAKPPKPKKPPKKKKSKPEISQRKEESAPQPPPPPPPPPPKKKKKKISTASPPKKERKESTQKPKNEEKRYSQGFASGVMAMAFWKKKKKEEEEEEDTGDIRNIVDGSQKKRQRAKQKPPKRKKSSTREESTADDDDRSLADEEPTTASKKSKQKKKKKLATKGGKKDESDKTPKKATDVPTAGRFNPRNLCSSDICSCLCAKGDYETPRGWTGGPMKQAWSPMAAVAEEQKSLDNISKNWPLVPLDKESGGQGEEQTEEEEGSSETSSNAESEASGSTGSESEPGSDEPIRIVIERPESQWEKESDTDLDSGVDPEDATSAVSDEEK